MPSTYTIFKLHEYPEVRDARDVSAKALAHLIAHEERLHEIDHLA